MQALIVDDDQLNVLLLSQLVSSIANVDPVTFTDPSQALAWCNKNDPDLVLVDYQMPQLNGLDFIAAFRKIGGKAMIPLIMATGETDADVRRKALELTANDFVSKPVDLIELRARINNMLALRKGQLQIQQRADWLAEEVDKATQEIKATEREVIFRLCRASEYRDPDTGSHILRMAEYAALIAKNLGFHRDEQDLIRNAAPMHDIGKMGIPDRILLKSGRLTDEEMDFMKRHTILGAEILSESNSRLLKVAAEIAISHHEKFDGSGYPYGLAGGAIPLYGRIVAVADVFDALTSERPYKQAWDLDRAMDFLRGESGKHFDPACVKALTDDTDAVVDIYNRYKEN